MTGDDTDGLPWAEFVLGEAKRSAKRLCRGNNLPATCDVDDMAQDSALHVLGREDYYRSKHAEQGDWRGLRRALKNACVDAIRKAKATPGGVTGRGAGKVRTTTWADMPVDVDRAWAQAEADRLRDDAVKKALGEALKQLPKRQHDVLAAYIDGLTQVQIAAEHGVSERTVRNDLRAAEATLKESLLEDPLL